MDLSAVLSTLFAGAQAVGARGVFQFVFSADNVVWSEVGDQVTIRPGRHPAADVTIELGEQDFAGILQGQQDVEELFASGRLRIGGQMGLATLLPQIIDAARRGSAPPEQTRDMNQRYAAPERTADRVSAAQTPLLAVERRPRDGLSVEEFRSRYLPQGLPVIISNALADWPLFNMSREESLTYFAELQGITRHGDYVEKTFSTERDFRSTSMADFIAALDGEQEEGVPPPYMGNNVLPTQLLELIRFPDYFEHSLYIKPRIWIGPKGTLTPLHRDDTDNLFAQVWGRKSFILAAPHHREALGTWSTSPEGGLEGCEVNPDAPDYERFPGAQEVVFLRIELEAGDLLFLPDGWFHQVESVSTSLSVNFWVNSGRGW
ncbi:MULTISPECIES: cupin-like domain-containing protein [unclassified Pseudomonas]|uniref:cupin-like domain-containing protein n=1 Tax=unclassified Pseudomonas TaxID=196821 RepID=UPI00244C51BC|nr:MULTISPECIES: cupin-like domain-containing protein [unclassified Pseudomonas]MDG9930334.1 cupin-like domain-containing protein [Pseudomonas sp. GD04042]MDH0484553.1 cupin-like domain-containing protein [Pseudomonas sp. GD04015]MDH0605989.1 cupin-like domain-containing protein [Pseudomonas sp. GD03869]